MATWVDTGSSVIAALRAADVDSYVLMPGGNFTQAKSWMVTDNSKFVHKVEDPLGKTMVDVHMYLDEYVRECRG